jgi:hypothetical protein
MCFFFFSFDFLLFHILIILRRIQRDIMLSTCYSRQILIKLEFSRQIFEKYSNIRFHGHPSSMSLFVSCERTDGYPFMRLEAVTVVTVVTWDVMSYSLVYGY